MNNKQILTAATDIAYMLLKYGAEVYRAEQSTIYICNAYGIKNVDVFAIPSSIVTTISDNDYFITKTKRIVSQETDLYKVERLNELSRYICNNKPNFNEIQDKIKKIEEIKPHKPYLKLLSYFVVTMSFTVLFGGTILESLIAAFIGVAVFFLTLFLNYKNVNPFIKTTFCSLTISFFSLISERLFSEYIHAEPILSGALMLLVPGLALTNCMRDFMANDYMAGMTKLTEALMTALASALGFAIVMFSLRGGI